MDKMNDDFTMTQAGDAVQDKQAETLPPDGTDAVTDEAKDGDVETINAIEAGNEEAGQAGTPPVDSRLEQMEASVRELRGYSTKLLDAMETIRKENEELKKALNGEPAEEERASEDDEKPLTKRELMELLSKPELVQEVEKKKKEWAVSNWQSEMAAEIKALQNVGIATPGSRLASAMDEFFQSEGDKLVGDPAAVKRAFEYAKKKVAASPAVKPPESPPASGTGSSKPSGKSELGKEITGTGADAFMF